MARVVSSRDIKSVTILATQYGDRSADRDLTFRPVPPNFLEVSRKVSPAQSMSSPDIILLASQGVGGPLPADRLLVLLYRLTGGKGIPPSFLTWPTKDQVRLLFQQPLISLYVLDLFAPLTDVDFEAAWTRAMDRKFALVTPSPGSGAPAARQSIDILYPQFTVPPIRQELIDASLGKISAVDLRAVLSRLATAGGTGIVGAAVAGAAGGPEEVVRKEEKWKVYKGRPGVELVSRVEEVTRYRISSPITGQTQTFAATGPTYVYQHQPIPGAPGGAAVVGGPAPGGATGPGGGSSTGSGGSAPTPTTPMAAAPATPTTPTTTDMEIERDAKELLDQKSPAERKALLDTWGKESVWYRVDYPRDVAYFLNQFGALSLVDRWAYARQFALLRRDAAAVTTTTPLTEAGCESTIHKIRILQQMSVSYFQPDSAFQSDDDRFIIPTFLQTQVAGVDMSPIAAYVENQELVAIATVATTSSVSSLSSLSSSSSSSIGGGGGGGGPGGAPLSSACGESPDDGYTGPVTLDRLSVDADVATSSSGRRVAMGICDVYAAQGLRTEQGTTALIRQQKKWVVLASDPICRMSIHWWQGMLAPSETGTFALTVVALMAPDRAFRCEYAQVVANFVSTWITRQREQYDVSEYKASPIDHTASFVLTRQSATPATGPLPPPEEGKGPQEEKAPGYAARVGNALWGLFAGAPKVTFGSTGSASLGGVGSSGSSSPGFLQFRVKVILMDPVLLASLSVPRRHYLWGMHSWIQATCYTPTAQAAAATLNDLLQNKVVGFTGLLDTFHQYVVLDLQNRKLLSYARTRQDLLQIAGAELVLVDAKDPTSSEYRRMMENAATIYEYASGDRKKLYDDANVGLLAEDIALRVKYWKTSHPEITRQNIPDVVLKTIEQYLSTAGTGRVVSTTILTKPLERLFPPFRGGGVASTASAPASTATGTLSQPECTEAIANSVLLYWKQILFTAWISTDPLIMEWPPQRKFLFQNLCVSSSCDISGRLAVLQGSRASIIALSTILRQDASRVPTFYAAALVPRGPHYQAETIDELDRGLVDPTATHAMYDTFRELDPTMIPAKLHSDTSISSSPEYLQTVLGDAGVAPYYRVAAALIQFQHRVLGSVDQRKAVYADSIPLILAEGGPKEDKVAADKKMCERIFLDAWTTGIRQAAILDWLYHAYVMDPICRYLDAATGLSGGQHGILNAMRCKCLQSWTTHAYVHLLFYVTQTILHSNYGGFNVSNLRAIPSPMDAKLRDGITIAEHIDARLGFVIVSPSATATTTGLPPRRGGGFLVDLATKQWDRIRKAVSADPLNAYDTLLCIHLDNVLTNSPRRIQVHSSGTPIAPGAVQNAMDQLLSALPPGALVGEIALQVIWCLCTSGASPPSAEQLAIMAIELAVFDFDRQ